MIKVFILFFRRMRAPLLVLIGAYSISIGGLVLIPGVTPEGDPWRFDFFHAFYFVSFMASTIGFGEIPHPFSGGQRIWTVIAVYLTVISWLYAIGTILSLIQDPTFKRAVAEWRFIRSVRHIHAAFYIVCGYGETGRLVVRELSRRGIRVVVVEQSTASIQDLELEDLPYEVPHILGDASESHNLLEAGIGLGHCRGVLALTSEDRINLKVAIAAKLLRKELKVVCVARSNDTMANMASFNTDHIVNPFYLFADHMARALHAPRSHLIYQWLVQPGGQPLAEPRAPPRGTWLLCGYGRFGKAIARYLQYEGVSTVVIEPFPDEAGAPEGTVIGRGTEAVTLREARIQDAVGVVAGTDDDANNLSIIMTARDLKPDLYFVARENRHDNHLLFDAAEIDLVMQSSRMIVWHILSLITTPLLDRFLRQARHRSEEWATELAERIREVCKASTPDTWAVQVDRIGAPAIVEAIEAGNDITLDMLERHPRDRRRILPCVPLMLLRDDEEILLPPAHRSLTIGDQVLFCGRIEADGLMRWATLNRHALDYLRGAGNEPQSSVGRWLAARARRRTPDGGA
jgi:Trk K+ transport system NAD-binding subunit